MAKGFLQELGEAVVLLRADASKLDEDLKKERGKLEKNLDDLSNKLKGRGTALSAGITAPIIAMGAAAVTAAFTIDDALDAIRIGTGATGEALKDLEASFADAFARVPDDALVVGQALADINTRTGATGKGLEDLTVQLLNLSRITNTDVNTNIAASTRLFGDWSIASDKQGDALDYVFKASQSTGIGVDQLMQKLVQFGAPLRQFNFTFEESAALMGKWEKEGVNAEILLSSLRIAMANFAREGVPLREGLDKTIQSIKSLGAGSEATSLAMKVFGARAGPDLAAAILEGRFAFEDLLGSIQASSETINQATEDTEDFREDLRRLANELTTVLAPLGFALIDVVEQAMPLLKSLGETAVATANFFGKLPDPVQKTALAVLAVAAAAGPATYGAGLLVGQWKNVLSVYGLLVRHTPGVVGALGRTASAAGLLGKGVGLVSLAFIGWKTQQWVADISALGTRAAISALGFKEFSDRMLTFTETMSASREMWSRLISGQKIGQEAFEEIRASIIARRNAEEQAIDTTEEHTKVSDDLTRQVEELMRQTDEFSEESLAQFQDQLQGATQKTDEFQNSVNSLLDSMGRGASTQGRVYLAALEQIGGVTNLSKQETEQWNDALLQMMEDMRQFGEAGTQTYAQIREAQIRLASQMTRGMVSHDLLGALGTGINMDEWRRNNDVASMTRSMLSKVSTDIRNSGMLNLGPLITLDPPPSIIRQFGRTIAKGLTGPGGFTDTMGTVVLDAITGGGDVGKALGASFGQSLGKSTADMFGGYLKRNLGQTLGGAIGSVLPGLGTLLGSGIGGLVSKIGGAIFGSAGRDMVEEFAASLGGFDELRSKLNELGAEGERLWVNLTQGVGRNNKEEAKKAIGEVTAALEAHEATALSLFEEEQSAREKLQSAIEKYGFTIEELGPKWREQRMHEMALELVEDYTLLTGSGIEADTVIRRMADSINKFVQTAVKTGSEVPEAMRPMLQRMVDLGLLVDADGKKIESLEDSGITFSMTMSQGFQGIISKLDELIRKITGELTPQLENLPSPTVDVQVRYNDPGFRPQVDPYINPQYADDVPQMSGGGIANWGTGTLAMLHGQEAVIPLDRLDGMLRTARDSGGSSDEVKSMLRMVQASFLEMKAMLPEAMRAAVQQGM